MTWYIVNFAMLDQEQTAAAARVLRAGGGHLPSGYQGPGEAEAEVDATARPRMAGPRDP